MDLNGKSEYPSIGARINSPCTATFPTEKQTLESGKIDMA